MINQEHERLAALLEQLAEPDAERRSEAAVELANLQDRRAVEPLIAALHDANELVRANAAWALGQLHAERAFDSLLLAIRDGRVDSIGLEALSLIDPHRAVEPLLQQLRATAWGRRWHAARELYFLGDQRAADALLDLLQHDLDTRVREMAAQALGKLHELRAVVLLIDALQTGPAAMHYKIVQVLGELGDPRAIDPLIEIARTSDNPYVRRKAAKALGKIGNKRALPVLRWMADHDTGATHKGKRVSSAARTAMQQIYQRQKQDR